jgi:hypothetical protein
MHWQGIGRFKGPRYSQRGHVLEAELALPVYVAEAIEVEMRRWCGSHRHLDDFDLASWLQVWHPTAGSNPVVLHPHAAVEAVRWEREHPRFVGEHGVAEFRRDLKAPDGRSERRLTIHLVTSVYRPLHRLRSMDGPVAAQVVLWLWNFPWSATIGYSETLLLALI